MYDISIYKWTIIFNLRTSVKFRCTWILQSKMFSSWVSVEQTTTVLSSGVSTVGKESIYYSVRRDEVSTVGKESIYYSVRRDELSTVGKESIYYSVRRDEG